MQDLNFFKKPLHSDSPEVKILANIVARDPNSVTGKNLWNLEQEFYLDPWLATPSMLKSVYRQYLVPTNDEWRPPLLMKLLGQRRVLLACGEDTGSISENIDSLCSS